MNENKQYKLNTLRHWYLGEYEWNGEKVKLVYGQFFNRPGIYDGVLGHTSIVRSIKINRIEKEYEIQTNNTLYHCSFDSLFFERQDNSPYPLPEYEEIKEEYYRPVDTETLSKDDMLLVVSNYCDFYFERLIYQNEDGSDGEYCGYPHIGNYTDSYLISRDDYETYDSDNLIDIRYYVLTCAFEFYSLAIGNKKKFWIENRGDISLHITGCGCDIDLEAGQRILALKREI